MRNRPETTTQNATNTSDDAMANAVNRWLENRRGRNSGGVAESFGKFENGSWRLYLQAVGQKKDLTHVLWVLVARGKHTTARLPRLPETATPELRARWCELAAPQLFDAYHAAKSTVVAKKTPKTSKKKG